MVSLHAVGVGISGFLIAAVFSTLSFVCVPVARATETPPCAQALLDDATSLQRLQIRFAQEFPAAAASSKRTALFAQALSELERSERADDGLYFETLGSLRQTLVETLPEPELDWYRSQLLHFVRKLGSERDASLKKAFLNAPFRARSEHEPWSIDPLLWHERIRDALDGSREAIRFARFVELEFARRYPRLKTREEREALLRKVWVYLPVVQASGSSAIPAFFQTLKTMIRAFELCESPETLADLKRRTLRFLELDLYWGSPDPLLVRGYEEFRQAL